MCPPVDRDDVTPAAFFALHEADRADQAAANSERAVSQPVGLRQDDGPAKYAKGLPAAQLRDYPGAMSSPQADMLRASIAGLDQATARYQTASREADTVAEDVFISLSEALFWARSLDEVFDHAYQEPYRAARDADGATPYLQGLRFARNRSTHQLALVAERAGLRPPLRPPMTSGVVYRWRPLAELPTPNPRHQAGMIEYGEYLAGAMAEVTLDRVRGWLHRAVELYAS